MPNITQAEVEAFLKEFRDCWDGRVLDRISSDNEDTIAVLKITPQHRAEEIRKLKYYDYYRGPSPDNDNPQDDVWEFGRKVKGQEVYIKIKVYLDSNGNKKGKCFSFHFSKWKITYPLKRKGA